MTLCASTHRAKSAALTTAAALALPMLMTGTANADTVSGCAQGWSEYPGTCIAVVTGAKNGSNHTQWVEKITVNAPREARSTPSLMEAWAGDGPTGVAWYASGNGTSFTWTINKWIKTDSGVCGSYRWSNGTRSIACITIKA